MIDYSIQACVEYNECKGLIYYLQNFLQDGDKIVVTLDESNTTQEMIDMVKEAGIEPNLHPLTTFAEITKYIRSQCHNPYFLGLCADEVPTVPLLKMCRTIFQQNPEIDAVGIPRINFYSNLTKDKARNMYVGPRDQDFLITEPKNEYGWHVWPDYQPRFTRNNFEVDYITYGEGVHSGYGGFKNVGYLPANPQFALLHVKSIEKQERMLRLYDKMEKG